MKSEEKQYGDEFLSNNRNIRISYRIATMSPFIIFPLLSFFFNDWWLLLGILFSNIGGLFSTYKGWPKILFIIIIASIAYSLKFGFAWNSYFNIFFLCYIYGNLTFTIGHFFKNRQENTISKIKEQVSTQIKQDLDNRK